MNLSITEKLFIENIHENQSYDYYQNIDIIREKYLDYRRHWANPTEEILNNPLCIDIELASICDLGCPHCYRQYIATPDKIMSFEMAISLIDQASKLGVPSIKFNWRGEPLMHPRIPEIIKYAKSKGIIETIINTNATHLNEKMSYDLIKSGLDLIIFSFDGGSKETYEEMRPGRFRDNKYENIIDNIRKFSECRKKLNKKYPVSRIQMVVTNKNRNVVPNYISTFNNIIDEVIIKQYTERGAGISDVDSNQTSSQYKYYKTVDGDGVYGANSRKICHQPFQRLLITYDGKVGMCCYDWGASYPVGYVSDYSFINNKKDYFDVIEKSSKKKKGYSIMSITMPKENNRPEQEVSNLMNIWKNNEINNVRCALKNNLHEKINICSNCLNKETYEWIKL